jgi:tripartite-type tricarboxylate transporter receptor subunit TctC
MRRRDFVQSALALGAVAAMPARAQQPKYPAKPSSSWCPSRRAGRRRGGAHARAAPHRARQRAGGVENKTGAGGNIGSDFVLKSPPDGYTLLNMSSSYPIQAAVSKVPFDPIADMQPIVMVSRDPVVLLVNPASPLRTAKDLYAAAKKSPDKLTYGSAGVGSIAHLGMEELAHIMDIRLVTSVQGHVAGVHRPPRQQCGHDAHERDLHRTAAQGRQGARPRHRRSPAHADDAGGADLRGAGLQGATNVVDWKAVAGPRGIPPDIVAFLNRDLNEILRSKAVTERFEAEGTTAVGGTPEQMMEIVRGDIERWKRVAATRR